MIREINEFTITDAAIDQMSGTPNPRMKEIMEILGIRQTQQYLVEEVQKVYRDQGVSIHDKHIELIVRQMTRRIGVQEPGDTGFLPGERVDAKVFRDTNKSMVEQGKRLLVIVGFGANIGAVSRHVFDPVTGAAKPFVSGYSSTSLPNLWDRSADVRATLAA